MNTRIRIMVPLAYAVSFALSVCAKPSEDIRNSPEARAARAERRMRNTGGFLEDRRNFKGHFVFINSQDKVKAEDIEGTTVNTMSQFFKADFRIVKGSTFEVQNAKALMSKVDAQGAIFLVDDPALPALLTAPQDSWAVVNVNPLVRDNPTTDVLVQRVKREMWRALWYGFGANSPADVCVMKPVFNNKDIDALPANALSQMPLYAIKDTLPRIGIGSIKIVSYKKACEEGWAPAPTNDYQKAIWAQVHAPPTDPLKITFDPKTDTK